VEEDAMLLLQPITVGQMRLRNRVMIAGHATMMAESGVPGPRYIAYLAERAKGGVGLIETEAASVHPTGQYPGLCYVGSDDCIPGYRAAADAVHAHGACLTAQIGHEGRQITSTHTELPLWSASAIPCPYHREMPQAMEVEEIREVVACYAAAAARMKRAGLDAVTIHGLHNTYLLGQFASPWVNKRTDEYGGSFDNRCRIVYEVVHAVRDAVGADFTVGLQMSGDDFDPRGLSADEYTEIARRLDVTGELDWIMVKAGRFGLSYEIPDMQHPSATWLHLAARFKTVVGKVKIGVVGRVDPWQAEGIVRNGHADLVAMTRQHIADPETVRKLQEGRADDIRPCIACNQGCVDMLRKHRSITCTVNPAVGREREIGLGTLKPAREPRRVVVVGGGPAGLKASEIAARRGHRVILLEAGDRLGGQVNVAARAPHRRDLVAAVDWLGAQLRSLGIEVRLKAPASAEDVLALDPDVVIVATGSRPTTRPIGLISYGVEQPPETARVTTAYDVLAGWTRPAGHVLVVDDGEGTFKSASVAEALLDVGCSVTLATPNAEVGASIGRLSVAALMPRLFAKGIALSPYTIYRGMEGGTVLLSVQGREVAQPADWVVVAGWHEPDAALYFALKGRVPHLMRVGDCLAARTLIEAIREGEAAGRAA
jgi:2,4-dienoyl-CoA reductase-like NADH-dependent reductase (Old Yellow Enzyme family)